VIPVLQLSSSLARPLINHSSTTHRLAESSFLSRSRPPYRSRNLAVPLEGYLETADGPRSEERRRRRADAFIYALGFEQSSRSKVDEDRRGVEERNRGTNFGQAAYRNEIKLLYLHLFELLVFEIKSEDGRCFTNQRKREREIKKRREREKESSVCVSCGKLEFFLFPS